MDIREKISKQPQFEIKYINENTWNKISEKEFLLNLHKVYDQITPIIKRLYKGEEIATSCGICRIRTRFK